MIHGLCYRLKFGVFQIHIKTNAHILTLFLFLSLSFSISLSLSLSPTHTHTHRHTDTQTHRGTNTQKCFSHWVTRIECILEISLYVAINKSTKYADRYGKTFSIVHQTNMCLQIKLDLFYIEFTLEWMGKAYCFGLWKSFIWSLFLTLFLNKHYRWHKKGLIFGLIK